MKALFISWLILVSVHGMCQLTPEQQSVYENKVVRFERMKNTGTIMMISGAVPALAGIPLIIKGIREMDNDYEDAGSWLASWLSGTGLFTVGIVVEGIGNGLIGGGLALSIIGNQKMKEYQGKLTIGFSFDCEIQGLRLVYRF